MGTHGESALQPRAAEAALRRRGTSPARTKPDERVIIHYGQLGRAQGDLVLPRSQLRRDQQRWRELDRLKADLGKSVADPRRAACSRRPSACVFERSALATHPVTFYDRFTMIDLRSRQAAASAPMRFRPATCRAATRWWVSHKYAPLQLERSGYLRGICTAIDARRPRRPRRGSGAVADRSALPALLSQLSHRCATSGVKPRRPRSGCSTALHAVNRAAGQRARAWRPARSGGKLKVAIEAGGPIEGELRYVLRKGDQILQVVTAGVTPRRWRAGFLYLDEVSIGSGELSAELVVPPPPLPTLPPGRFTVRGAGAVDRAAGDQLRAPRWAICSRHEAGNKIGNAPDRLDPARRCAGWRASLRPWQQQPWTRCTPPLPPLPPATTPASAATPTPPPTTRRARRHPPARPASHRRRTACRPLPRRRSRDCRCLRRPRAYRRAYPASPEARDVRPPVSLTPSQVADLQTRLTAAGFYHGQIDGVLDGPTLRGIRAFQQAAACRSPACPTPRPSAPSASPPPRRRAATSEPRFRLSPSNQSTHLHSALTGNWLHMRSRKLCV